MENPLGSLKRPSQSEEKSELYASAEDLLVSFDKVIIDTLKYDYIETNDDRKARVLNALERHRLATCSDSRIAYDVEITDCGDGHRIDTTVDLGRHLVPMVMRLMTSKYTNSAAVSSKLTKLEVGDFGLFGEKKVTQDDPNTASAPEAGQPWKFDETVANSFSDMLQRSIPGYNDMRDVILRLGSQALKGAGEKRRMQYIVDMGASNGESIAPFYEAFPRARVQLMDISEPMLDKLRTRFKCKYSDGVDDRVNINNFDLRCRHDAIAAQLMRFEENSPLGPNVIKLKPTLVMAILTLIFVPINFRPNILRGIYESLDEGGMFIITEKLQGNDYATDNVLVDAYHGLKADNGYSYEAIERKRLSLEHVQVPLTQQHNERDLRNAGFRHIETVHRYLNFATFIAIK